MDVIEHRSPGVTDYSLAVPEHRWKKPMEQWLDSIHPSNFYVPRNIEGEPTMTEQSESYEGWAIVEAMGHQQVAGKVSEAIQYGTPMLRVDVYVTKTHEGAGMVAAGIEEPDVEDKVRVATQYYGGASIYRLTPCDEATALAAMDRAVNSYTVPEVVRAAVERALPPPESPNFDYRGDTDGE